MVPVAQVSRGKQNHNSHWTITMWRVYNMGRLTVYARPGQQSRIINRLNTEQRSPRLSLRFLINYRSSKALADRTPSPLGEVNIWRGGWGPAGGPTLYLLCNSGSRPPFSPCGQVRPPQVHLTKPGDGTKVRIKVIGERFTIYKAGEAERASYLPASTSPIWRRMPQGRINSSET